MIDLIIGSTLTCLLWFFIVAPGITDSMAGKFNEYSYLEHVKFGFFMTLGLVGLCLFVLVMILTVGFVCGEHDIFTRTYYMMVK